MILKNSKLLALILSSVMLLTLNTCGKKRPFTETISRPSIVKKEVKKVDSVIPPVAKPGKVEEIVPKETPEAVKVPAAVPEMNLKARTKGAKVRAAGDHKKIVLPTEEEEGLTRCFSLKGNAVTGEEAFFCSQAHWQRSRELMTVDMDSAYIYCNRALTLYENGSLFTLKAQILYAEKRYSEAVLAAECSIARHDHWEPVDRPAAAKVRVDAYTDLDKKYPSIAAKESIRKATADYESIIKAENK